MTRRYRAPDPMLPRALKVHRCTHSGCTRPAEPGKKSCLICLEKSRECRRRYVSGRAKAAAYLDAEWAKRKKAP